MAAVRVILQDLVFVTKEAALLRRFVQESRVRVLHPCTSLVRNFSGGIQSVQTLSPAVRYLVDTHKIQDTGVILGTGPKSRLLKGDILKYLANLKDMLPVQPVSGPAKPEKVKVKKTPSLATHAQYTDISMATEVREAAVGYVQAKREVPHVYLTVDCEIPRWLLGQDEDLLRAHIVKCIAQTVQDSPGVCLVWDITGPRQLQPSLSVSTTTMQRVVPVTSQGVESSLSNVPIDSVCRTPLRELAATMATIGSTSGGATISVAFASVTTGQTSILLPGQTLALHVIGRLGAGATSISVCVTGDGRVLELEMLAQWLSVFRENCGRTV